MREDVLKIEFQPVFDKWAWRIIYQNEDVLKRGEFIDEDLKIESHYSSEFVDGFLFIRGEFKEHDKKINICTAEEKAIIEKRAKFINEKYGIFKPWRAEKYGNYFFIKSELKEEVWTSTERFSPLDDEKYKSGNYFKTQELAEKYLSDLKEFSRKWHEGNESYEKEEV